MADLTRAPAPKFNEDFVFPVVNGTATDIRLLELQPADSVPGTLICSYRTTSLDKPDVSYEALSYAWGDIANSHGQSIVIDTSEVLISQNLYDALLRLQPPFGKAARVVWIDALCIDQRDIVEKATQVGLMRRIYTQCSQCVFYMGELGDVSEMDAKDGFEMLTAFAENKSRPDTWPTDLGDQRYVGASDTVKTLLHLPWWERIWTVQEAILPREATVIWGPLSLPWAVLQSASDNVMAGLRTPPIFANCYAQVALTVRLIGLQASRDEFVLFLFWRWRVRKATDPRDKIYGLLGIRPDILHDVPALRKCDYTTYPRDLFLQVSLGLIKITNDLVILIGKRGEIAANEDLPRWAIDFSGVKAGTPYPADFFDHHSQWYSRNWCADSGLRGVGDGLVTADNDLVLILHGLYVDEVVAAERSEYIPGRTTRQPIENEYIRRGASFSRVIEQYTTWCAKNDKIPATNWMSAFLGLIHGKMDSNNPNEGDESWNWTTNILRGQCVFFTKNGHVGLGPQTTQPGQQLWVVGGCRFPVLVDPLKSKDGQQRMTVGMPDLAFFADCFVYGIMKGEAVEQSERPAVDIRLH